MWDDSGREDRFRAGWGAKLDGVPSIPPDAFKVVCLLGVLREGSGKLAENVAVPVSVN